MENHLENDTGSAGSGIRQNPFSELLSISLKDELNEKLQKSFGGYSKKSVGQYVSSMRSNLQRIQQQMERQINDLLAEKASVSQECTVLREQLKETEASLQKVQDQIVNQKYYEESREASEQELQKFRAENQRLSEMLADYEQTCEQKKRVEALLVEKENEIVRLNESLSRYQKECEELRSRTARLEQAAETASRNPDKTELSNLRREKEMADEQCRKLAQQLKESRRVLLEKSRGLEASRAALEKERESISLRQQQADDTQETKYRQMAQRLKEGQDALEKKKEELEAARNAFQVDEAGQCVRLQGVLLDLTRREFQLLSSLLAAQGRILSRHHLLDAVWGLHSDSTDRTVDTHIKTLRAKLRAVVADQDFITTHRGMGYSLRDGG